jgi:adenosylcobinamide-GDP ribazoletransferase
MHVLKSLVIAFSIYSKIPVPQFEWKDEDMKYMLCFFPWIGAVIGVCIYLWNYACAILNIGQICYTMISVAIPLVITGGFHVDGFMDTMDAFHSYQPKEKKLEILKDSHIGAFSVIMLAVYGLIYIGAFSEITNANLIKIVCAGFFLSRCLSGIAIVYFPLAKKDGMLYTFATSSQKNVLKWSLILQCTACICFMLYQSILAGMFAVLTAFMTFAYYYKRTKKELGGINGDTAGYFVLICEESIVVVTAICAKAQICGLI